MDSPSYDAAVEVVAMMAEHKFRHIAGPLSTSIEMYYFDWRSTFDLNLC
jgi:hypothetical protein